MFSSPTPAPGSRALASNALRSAGLIDRDERMRDVDDRPGGRKGSSKIRSHRPRPIDAFKDSSGKSSNRGISNRSLANRITPTTDPLSIRGAASGSSSLGRGRRNAISLNGSTSGTAKFPRRVATVGVSSIDVIKQFVRSRYDPKTQFLNLENMAEDDWLKKNKIPAIGAPGSAQHEATVIFKIAGRLTPPVQTISLANNQLRSGSVLIGLTRYLPRLANLSLANNRLRDWKDLESVSAKKGHLENLKELVLAGNPLRDNEFKHGRGEQFKSEIARRFTSLVMLDSEPIAKIGFDAPEATASAADPATVQEPTSAVFPCEMGPSFITGVDGSIVSNFLMRFFTCFDTQRGALQNAYDTAATFSFSCNTTIPERSRISKFLHTMPKQKNLTWNSWITHGSRNLSRLDGETRTVKSLHIGPDEILRTISALPPTKHDISGPGEKFCLDAFPVAHGRTMGLLLCVHGEFTELTTQGIRSFDRSFILAPAADGSHAKADGWDVVVLSDQLIIRNYSSHESWKPGRLTVQAGEDISTNLPPDQQQILHSIPEPQKTMVMQVCQRTKLNVRFSVDCLTGNGWDIEKAIANFNQVKATLSADAYLQ